MQIVTTMKQNLTTNILTTKTELNTIMKILNDSEIYFTLQKFPKKKSEEWGKPSRKEKDKKKDYSKERQRKRGEI